MAQAAANAALQQANRPRLPQLVAQENTLYAMNAEVLAPDSNKAVLRVEQGTLPFLGSEWKQGEEKKAEFEAAQLAVIESTQDVQLLVKQLYFAILRDQDEIRNLDDVEKEFDRLVATVTPKFQIGHAPQFDLVKVRSSTYDLLRQRDLTRSQWVGEKSELNQILHLGSTDFTLDPLSRVPDISAALGGALSAAKAGFDENPTLIGLRKDIEASNLQVSVTKLQRMPSLSAAFEYGFEGLTPTTMVNQWAAYAQFRLTLFDWGLISSQVDQAEAQEMLSQKRLEAETEKTRSDYDQTVALAQAHLEDHRRLESLLPQLQKAARVAVERYRVGGMGILETTDAINLWSQGLINERSAYYGYLSDLAKLERLSGKATVAYE